ncbi:MAG: c-type cytochrome [Fuerstiella sp.]|nr:c-type cytochrome [Fuerstiella sp.]
MKRFLQLCFVFLFLCCPRIATADDETESLDLLVKTLNSLDDVKVRHALLRGMLAGLEGRRNVEAPQGWSKLSQQLAKSKDNNVRELSAQLSQIFGDRKATELALVMLTDPTADPNAQRTSLRLLLTHQNQEASALLETLLDNPALRLDAIRGYAMVENASAPTVLLGRYPKMSPELKRAVIETLATRKRYAEALLSAVEAQTVSREEIPAHVARSLKAILGDRFVRVFGEVRPIAQDRQKLLARYKKIVTPEKIADADASRGRAVFTKTCAACHVLYGEGGKIGPDLTGSNRANLDYILLNSVDPSYDVPTGYKMVTIVTVDGRVVSGVIAEEDGTRVVLKTVEQPRLVIAKEDIEERKISSKSMMPDGQLEKMQRQEVIDLIKYLRTTEQVEMAK